MTGDRRLGFQRAGSGRQHFSHGSRQTSQPRSEVMPPLRSRGFHESSLYHAGLSRDAPPFSLPWLVLLFTWPIRFAASCTSASINTFTWAVSLPFKVLSSWHRQSVVSHWGEKAPPLSKLVCFRFQLLGHWPPVQ